MTLPELYENEVWNIPKQLKTTAMQKDYVIMNHFDRVTVMTSIHSNNYPDLLMVGYTVAHQGTKKECETIMNEEESLCY